MSAQPESSENSGSSNVPEVSMPPLPPRAINPAPRASLGSGNSPDATDKAMVFKPLERDVTLGAILDALLKQPGTLLHELKGTRKAPIIGRLIIIVVTSMMIYGLVMGSMSGGTQWIAAPVKLTLGMSFSLLICLPSLYIFLCLSGADVKIGEVSGALLAMVAVISLLLIGFAPVAWIFSQSTDSFVLIGILHLLFWVIGLWFGARFVGGLVKMVGAQDQSHIRVWMFVFVLVSLQMTTVLRPLIGTSPDFLPKEKKFFLSHWMSNLNEGSR
jgi:hypothetical protein